jgi:AmmeMemoRadiSam system protein A
MDSSIRRGLAAAVTERDIGHEMTAMDQLATSSSAPGTLAADDRRILLTVARSALARRSTDWREDGAGPEVGPALLVPRAAFVTLTRRDTGALRGCRGEVAARRPLVESVARMAIAAAMDDPRFPPVEPPEAPGLRITINALGPLQPVRPDEIVVGRHGLVLTVGGNAGLLLPEVPLHHGWDRDGFLTAVCRKAGVADSAWRRPDAELRAFETEAWSDD